MCIRSVPIQYIVHVFSTEFIKASAGIAHGQPFHALKALVGNCAQPHTVPGTAIVTASNGGPFIFILYWILTQLMVAISLRTWQEESSS